MKVFVTGANGQLGSDVVNELIWQGHSVIASDIHRDFAYRSVSSTLANVSYVSLDITCHRSVLEVIRSFEPDTIIHCAAWTNVDKAEDESNKKSVKAINADGTRWLAEAAKSVDAKMVYISTDYVFNGSGDEPRQPDDKNYDPLNFYGQTKLEGELAVSSNLDKYFIVRTQWVFGLNGKNFVMTMVDAGRRHNAVRVVNDQIGTPTYTYDFARFLVSLIETDKYGYYHATNEGSYVSWYEFCCEIYQQVGLSTQIIPVSTAKFNMSVAKRPLNSRLDRHKLIEMGFKPLPDWKSALTRYIKEAGLADV